MEKVESVVEESARSKWARIIEEHRGSGLPVAVFCRERSLAVSSYYGWRAKLSGARSGAEFVEAQVVEDRGSDSGTPVGIKGGASAGDIHSAAVRIELACGRRVVVSRGFDRRLLLEVICALEETAGVRGVRS